MSTHILLIPDIIQEVFDWIELSNPLTSRRNFLACALVCSHWSKFAQCMLFRRLTIRTLQDWTLFMERAPKEADGSLSCTPRVLHFHLGADQERLSQAVLIKVLQTCHQLRELRLGIHSFNGWDNDVEAWFNKSSLKVDALRFSSYSSNGHQALPLLLRALPRLKYMTLEV